MRCFIGSLRWSLLGGIAATLLTACATVTVSPAVQQCMARQDRFIHYDNHTMLDQCTKLMWMTQDYRNLEGRAPLRWRAALTWVDTINQQRFAGYTDWRPATLKEYQAIYQAEPSRRSYRGRAVGYPKAFADGGGEWSWVEEVAEWGSGHIHRVYTYSFRNGKYDARWVHTAAHPQPFHATGSIRLLRGPVATAAQ